MDYKADPARLPPAGVRKLGEYFSHEYIKQLEKCNEKICGNHPLQSNILSSTKANQSRESKTSILETPKTSIFTGFL